MATAIREVGVWRQTRTLLLKNYLVKCRTKKSSVQEILFPLFFLFWLILISMMHPNKKYEEVPDMELSPMDKSILSNVILGFTPVTNITRDIMQKVSTDHLPNVIITEEYTSEKELLAASLSKSSNFVGVVFKDFMSYELRFFPDMIPVSSVYMDSRAGCSESCEAVQYWSSGFTVLQASIDTAIIQLKTNVSFWKELEPTKAVLMGETAVVEIDTFPRGVILIYLVIAFSPFGYFLAIHIVAEKEKKLKEFLKIMGLHDTAFWLSWVLLYTSLIFLMSLLMAVIATASSLFPQSSCFVIFLLFFLYGLSSVFFALMLTPLFKKSKHVGIVEFLVTVAFGFVGLLIVLMESFPKSLVWLLSPFCQCTFLIGIAQVMHLEDFNEGALFSNLTEGPYPLIITVIMLALNSIFYVLLAVYLDQVIPGEFGLRRSSFYFLKPSYWSKSRRNYKELSEGNVSRNISCSEIVEPVSSEFKGKEAIRISGIQKTYRKKGENVEALRSLSFDIYEGQITALLGHSGTGKSTLMNILCGLCPPSDGFASVYGHRVSEIDEMFEARKMIGICPQLDIHFDVLTVEENLSILASIKGVPANNVIQEVQKVLLDLDMQAIKDNQAKKLSGGQKRKLSIGIAVLGNPKVLLLDEPTAGMDPCSRHIVWNLLKCRRANRVTVFSTHFMDEADILADRKAVISQGMLKCVGSSIFLKSKWGIGYRLSMYIDRYCATESLSSLVKQHIPAATLLQQSDQQLVYSLPFKDMDKFSGLFAALDTHSDLGVISYGVSMTTLEDVFLKLEVEAEIDQADYSIFTQQPREEELHSKPFGEMEQSLLIISETRASLGSTMSVWKQQVFKIAKVHFLTLKRESKSVRSVLLLLLIFFTVQIFMFLVHHSFKNAAVPVKLVPDLYFLKPGDKPDKYRTSLLLQNSTGENSDISDLLRFFTNQSIMVTMFNDSDYVSAAPHSAALNVMQSEKDYVFTAVFNSTMVYSLPVLMNIISNYYLYRSNVTESIRVWNTPFVQGITDIVLKIELYFQAALLGVIVTAMPPYFAMENAENHKIKAYTQLKLSGLLPSAYWIGQALVDVPLFTVVLTLMLGSLFSFHHGLYFYAVKFLSVVFCLIGYVPSVILFTYITSFTFKKIVNTREFWSFIYSVTALACIAVTEITFFMGYTVTVILHYALCIAIPIYPLLGCLICFIKISWKNIQKKEDTYNPWDSLLVAVISPYLQCVLWIFLLQYCEKKYGGRSLRKDPFFRTLTTKSKSRKCPEPPINEDEDEDVRAERVKVKELLSCQHHEEKPAIMVNNLHKEYEDKKDFLLTRKIKKVANKYVSFCVKKGEILGLLGPNGAGKSTIINILVGDIEPTSGQVFLRDYSSDPAGDDDSVKCMGYCPQINPLWPEITLQEHFEIYGAVRGISAGDMQELTTRITNVLDLKEHLQKTVKKLPAGIKRKLCFALSMLGNPPVTLLDEPSTGMDPKAKQHMWSAIRAAFNNKTRAAILATHCMEEVEAVCDRVAILVSGQLRCIGTVQHLKSKFGKGYFLEIKLKDWIENQEVDRLQREIQHIFPNASRQESFSSILAYKIPKEDVQSLSQSFSKLEEAKHTFAIEEYSFSQATLEQVFVELTKEQEEEDNTCGTSNSTLRWERTQEDRVVF
ncbi:cholesterol transporter ABCA5 isoform X1 [Kogia breviceps]|uniref:cholesterol transporter ABCA5 isoform X1 n=2 Tax=Kogia breviceps TaxID=27615 RepID=UPI0027960C5B|nr:cholesterol transporter ABCA5 isoform X1 [Kogia breviceps]XP_058904342.1 cholesterol transporter ABCA5 isoform X1 [Kogia breviceps]XP_058904343.1 cholesterol transporter ABCA5 isoform X1 [Kogia breviceps]XP_058904344.1 cholesterol transporter ABCA5 isoform X1 [Kogia breviceps]